MTSNQNIPNTHLGPTAAGLRAILQQPENQPQLHDSQLQAHSQQQLQSQLQSKTQPQPPLQPQSQSQLHIQQSQAQQHHQQQQQQQPNTQSQIAPQTSNTSSITNEFHAPPNISQQSITSNQNTTSTSTSTPTQQAITSPLDKGSTSSKDVPDLSLLARVPPPANPADQNPPCNTLYVGNLPPDATESELRTLFSPQKGLEDFHLEPRINLLLIMGLAVAVVVVAVVVIVMDQCVLLNLKMLLMQQERWQNCMVEHYQDQMVVMERWYSIIIF